MLNRADKFDEGISQVSRSIFNGISQGVSGLVTQPYNGAIEGGVKGFFNGVARGLSGIVTKPIVGVLDATSKTTEGLSTMFLDQQVVRRKRQPRCFYQKL